MIVTGEKPLYNNPYRQNFNGFYNNKTLIKSLEFASDNGALFGGAVSAGLSAFVRPIVTLATPKAEKKNKQYACAKSIASSIVNFGVMCAITMPIAAAVKNIESNPQKFLSQNTQKFFQAGENSLKASKNFQFISQFFKLSSSFLTSAPKALITCLLVVPLMSYFFNRTQTPENNLQNKQNVTFGSRIVMPNLYNSFTEKISKGLAKIMEQKPVQTFSEKFKKSNLAQHIFVLNDILLSGLFIGFTAHNKKIEENRRKTLMANVAISTALTIAGGYSVDKLLEKPTEKFIKNFNDANKNLKNLDRYAQGIKTAKSALILGGLYYVISPVIATMLAEKVTPDKK